MDVTSDVINNVNSTEQRATSYDMDGGDNSRYTPQKNGGLLDSREDKEIPDLPDLSGTDQHLNSTDTPQQDVVLSKSPHNEVESEVVVEPDQVVEEPEPVKEELIEFIHSERELAPPPPARKQSSSSSSSDSEYKGAKDPDPAENVTLPEVIEDTIHRVDRKDIEKNSEESFSPPTAEEVGRTIERSETSEVSAAKEIIDAGDHTEVKVTERKVTSLQEVEELVKEYSLDNNDVPPTAGLDDEVLFTKEVHLVEDFTTIRTEKEVISGGIVKTEVTVEERVVKEETEVGDQEPDAPSKPVEGEAGEINTNDVASPDAHPTDPEQEEVDNNKDSPSKVRKGGFFEFFKRKPHKDKEQEEPREGEQEQPKEQEEEKKEEPKEEEGVKEDGKQTPEKKKRHFLIFKKPESKAKSNKEPEEETGKSSAEDKNEDQEQEEERKSEEGEQEPDEEKAEKKRKYHFFHFKKSEAKDHQEKEEHLEGVEEGEKEQEQTENDANKKVADEDKERGSTEKKKYHFFTFKKSEPKDNELKTEGEEIVVEEKEPDTKEENLEDSQGEEGDKGVAEKKKYHFFPFRKSEQKENDSKRKEEGADKEDVKEETAEESKPEDTNNKNAGEKKKYHFFAFRKSEPKESDEKRKAEESGEENDEPTREGDTDGNKSEDNENRNTLDKKKKRHFFHFHKTEQKDSSEDKSPKEEDPASESRDEDKSNSSPNRSTLDRKKRGFFNFKKSEPKEAEEQEEGEQPEESDTKQTPEKKKLSLFKVFPTSKDKKEKKERVTVEQKLETDESPREEKFINTNCIPSGDAEARMMEVSPDETERHEIFKTTDRPKSFIMSDDGPSPAVVSPTHAATTATTPQKIRTTTRPSPQPSTSQLVTPLHSPGDLDAAVARPHSESSGGRVTPGVAHGPGHFVVVAIDFGTTFSGYAFSFTRDPDSIHMMRKWEGGDPGVINQKTPTCLLLHPDGKFHSFGFTARDFFHDLDPQDSKKWLYFDKFKMTLHYNAELNKDTMIKASNGKLMQALSIFTHALRFFKEHALQELSDQSSTKILNEDVRWVITVPAIWKAAAKQFMRQAAYNAGIGAPEYPDQLLIALEPEAASIYVRRLRMHQLVPERHAYKTLSPRKEGTPEPMNMDKVCDEMRNGTRYIVIDCGGGTVDITVHEMESKYGNLHELYKATGGPYGSVGVDIEFEKLLVDIFGSDFMEAFKYKRPAGFVDLMIAFESRKRAATPYKNNPLNVSLPFSFIDYHKKFRNSQVESAIRKYGDKDIRWSSQGMLRLNPEAMRRLFQPTLDRIKQSVGDVLNNPGVRDIRYMFLVGGFSESQILQHELRREFGHLLRIIIPQDVSLTILKGAVCFGMDPTVVKLRKSRMTYGVGVLNRFVSGKHPRQKLVHKDGVDWCTDVFDKFVITDQSVALGDTTLRSYTPAKAGQKTSIINIYCSERSDSEFITDRHVERVGSLCLDLSHVQYGQALPRRREIQTRMIFGDTEIKVTALDVATGKCVRAAIDFLSK